MDTEAQVEDKLLSQVEITNLTMEPGRKKEEAKWRRIALNFLGSIADDGRKECRKSALGVGFV